MYCVSSAASADNVNGNASDSIIYQRHKLYVPVVNVSARDNQKYQNFLENDLKDQFIGMNVKQKEMIKIWQINLDIFSNQNIGVNRLFILLYLNRETYVRQFKTRIEYLPKSIMKNYNVIKNFYDQPSDSDMKRYEDIRKLTIGQGDDYTTGCLLDYE